VDLRYEGQSYELNVPARADAVNLFHEAHASRYGYRHSHRPVRLVTARLRSVGLRDKPALVPSPTGGGRPPQAALLDAEHQAWWADCQGRPELLPTAVYDRQRLRAGHRVTGPAIVCEYSATVAVPPGWRLRVDAFGGLLLRTTPRQEKGGP